MPVMDGFEASRQIRKFERDNRMRQTFIIALTGLAAESAQIEAYASGIDLFLSKPVKFKEVKTILTQVDESASRLE